MITSRILKAARLSRVLVGGAALAIASAMVLMAPAPALAQAKSNVAGCASFSSFSFDSGTNTLTVNNCATTTPPPAPAPAPVAGASSYSIVLGAVSTTTGNSINVTVQRTGGTMAEGLDLNASATGLTGWAFNGVGSNAWHTLNFASGEMSKSISFIPGSTAGSLTLMLGGVIGTNGSTTVGGGQTVTVTLGVSQAPPPPPGCATSATYNEVFQYANQKIVFSMKPGETGSAAFTPSGSTALMYLSSTETINTPADADHEVVLSKCPGDFTLSYPCRYQANYVGSSMQGNTAASLWQCPLTPGVTYYLNVRQVKLRTNQSDPVQPSCLNPPSYGNGKCEVRLQNTGL